MSVPFVGCKSDGQAGPVEAPEDARRSLPMVPKGSPELAYYSSAQEMGVLAPRGWYCFATYGSGGDTLYVTREPIDSKHLSSSSRPKIAGPAIQISRRFGGTSGRDAVAEIIARVFPAYKPFVISVMQDFNQPANSFPFGPYPTDTLTYKGKRVVQYRTPAQADGLGTHSWFEKSDRLIHGVAILVGPTPDLLLLAVRLPPDLESVASTVIRHVEHEFAHLPLN